MATDETFNLFHRYNRLVRRQLVKPLTHDCGSAYITSLGRNDQLVLSCTSCNTEVEPGQNTLDNVRAVVKEHFSD